MIILIDKTEGEARGKIKSVEDATDGINAYRIMNQCFTKLSGQGVAERRTKVLVPHTVESENQVVRAIEKLGIN